MLKVTDTVRAPASVAWRLLTDSHAWSRWGPSVRAVEVPARLIGPGLRGRVQTSVGLWLPFEITDWQADRHWAWKVAGIPDTGHTVTPTGPDACRVTFTIPRWAPFYVPVCRAALRKLNVLAVDAARLHEAAKAAPTVVG